MRNIKFRVWDKDLKQMHICGEDIHDSISFSQNNEAFYYNLQNGCGSLTENSSYVLMQYTGLKDKNGKEIYEGDLVGDKSIKWVVKWNTHRMGFSLYPTTEQIYDEMPVNVENKIHFEILGNIYDNPELLKEVK